MFPFYQQQVVETASTATFLMLEIASMKSSSSTMPSLLPQRNYESIDSDIDECGDSLFIHL